MRLLEAASGICARLLFAGQLLRLRLDAVFAAWFGRDARIAVVASWTFPREPEGFVYTELNDLRERGYDVRLFYGHRERARTLSRELRWTRYFGRRVFAHPAVCVWCFRRASLLAPDRVAMIVSLISRTTGISEDALVADSQFLQAFAFARAIEAYRPQYIHSYFFYEGSLFALVSAHLLGIPRGITCHDDGRVSRCRLSVRSLHLRQSSIIVPTTEAVEHELRVAEPRAIRAQFVDTANFHARIERVLRRGSPALGPPAPSPLVSVIVIFLNAEAYIADAVESVLLQTDDRWELIFVDDGSVDGSRQYAQSLAKRFPQRIQYLEHPNHENRGMSASRNRGGAAARGRYIAFIDADDVWAPFKLWKQIDAFDRWPDAAMVFGAAEYWHSWTGNEHDLGNDQIPAAGVETDRLYEPGALSTRLYPLGLGTAPCPSDLMVRRERFAAVGGFEEQFRGESQLYEDQAFLAKIYLSSAVFIASASWIRYRIHPASCSSGAARAGSYQRIRGHFLEWFGSYFAEQPQQPVAVAAALAAATSRSAQELSVQLGDLRRVTPISTNWGFERGCPVDRVYIESFLERWKSDVRGRVLEVEDRVYTQRFGGTDVTTSDVLHVVEGNPVATIVGDLTRADHIPSNAFDCVVLTQVLQLIFESRAAVHTLHRILKPGGVLLATFPGLSRISHEEWEGSWYWQFTSAGARRLFEEVFVGGHVTVEVSGNVLTSAAFLYGLAAEDLTEGELRFHDPDYELLIAVRAAKATSPC